MSSQVVFEASLCCNRISRSENLQDVESGQADFVVQFGTQDFKCFQGKNELIITPLIDKTYSRTEPPGLGPSPLGLLDHVKFYAMTKLFVAPDNGQDLVFNWCMAGKQFGVENHPFGNAVKNPNEDLRLAMYGANLFDYDTFSNNGWAQTNEIIYAQTERLAGLEQVFGNYFGYQYAIPVFRRNKDVDPLEDFHHLQIRYNKVARTVTWLVDGIPRFKITNPGVRLNETNAFVYSKKKCQWKPLKNPQRFQLADFGGQDTPLTYNGFRGVISICDRLDALQPNNIAGVPTCGLVRLVSLVNRITNPFYLNPITGNAEQFVYDCQLGPVPPAPEIPRMFQQCIPPTVRLFGQGAVERIKGFNVALEPQLC